jgi:hypothetical protein
MFKIARAISFGVILSFSFVLCASVAPLSAQPGGKAFDDEAGNDAKDLLKDGKQIFRYDTFGSEAFWGDALQLHKAIAGERTVASATACRQKPRCPSGSRSMRTRYRTL